MQKRILLACTGMVFVASCSVTRTLPQTAASPQVRFESALAAQTFYEAVISEQFPDPGARSLTFELAPLDIKKETVQDSGSILGGAVWRADSNRDRMISDAEAKRFASSIAP